MSDVLGIGKAVEKLADPVIDLLKRVAGPAADEIGLTLQDAVHVYRTRRAYRLAEKFHCFCVERHIDPRPVGLKLLLPVLDYASVEDDEDLHTMWANLLTNSADPSQDEALPSFAYTLKQLSREEAMFLNAFYDKATEFQKSSQKPFLAYTGDLLDIDASMSHSASSLSLLIDDLQRLGLLRMDTKVYMPEPLFESFDPVPADLKHGYYITVYGKNFVKSCRAPAMKPSTPGKGAAPVPSERSAGDERPSL